MHCIYPFSHQLRWYGKAPDEAAQLQCFDSWDDWWMTGAPKKWNLRSWRFLFSVCPEIVLSHIIFFILTIERAIGERTCCELFEFHHIACECACLIWENILNLAQFFVQIRWLGPSCHVLIDIIHGSIVGYEHCLEEFHNFKCNKERDGYEVSIEVLV